MDASQHVQTGALWTHENLHDECANGLGNDVGGEAKVSSSRDEAATCNDKKAVLPAKVALPTVGSDVDLLSVSSDEPSGGVDVDAAVSCKDNADQATLKDFCNSQGTLPSLKEVDECAKPKVFSRVIVIELFAGSARLSAALAVDDRN